MKQRDYTQIIRIVGLCLLAYCLMGSYSIARPTIDSLFLEHYRSDALPIAWLMTAFAAALVMMVYNRYNVNHSLMQLFSIGCVLSASAFSLFLMGTHFDLPGCVFLLYVLKEVYMVLLVEIFWSLSSIVFETRVARWIFGLFLFCGQLGSITANNLIGFAATRFGTSRAIWFIVPVLLLALIITRIVSYYAKDKSPEAKDQITTSWRDGLHVIQSSRYLYPLLIMIVVTQIVVTLIDFEFNQVVQNTYPDVDVRTGVIGRVYAFIDMAAIVTQLCAGLILRYLGIRFTVAAIPIIISACLASFVFFPRFATMVLTKVSSKTFDYSIMRAVKEILYIPLSRREVTQGKAFIDIFAYRVSKAFSSILVLFLVWIQLANWISPLALFCQIFVLISASVVGYRYTQLLKSRSEHLS